MAEAGVAEEDPDALQGLALSLVDRHRKGEDDGELQAGEVDALGPVAWGERDPRDGDGLPRGRTGSDDRLEVVPVDAEDDEPRAIGEALPEVEVAEENDGAADFEPQAVWRHAGDVQSVEELGGVEVLVLAAGAVGAEEAVLLARELVDGEVVDEVDVLVPGPDDGSEWGGWIYR